MLPRPIMHILCNNYTLAQPTVAVPALALHYRLQHCTLIGNLQSSIKGFPDCDNGQYLHTALQYVTDSALLAY